jgi:hypothetical protein
MLYSIAAACLSHDSMIYLLVAGCMHHACMATVELKVPRRAPLHCSEPLTASELCCLIVPFVPVFDHSWCCLRSMGREAFFVGSLRVSLHANFRCRSIDHRCMLALHCIALLEWNCLVSFAFCCMHARLKGPPMIFFPAFEAVVVLKHPACCGLSSVVIDQHVRRQPAASGRTS